jgi:hypothetical protein
MGVPSQPLPTVGQPNSTEDAKVRAALSEIQTILTANVDANNLAAGAVTQTKLATAVANGYLKLLTSADRKLAFGVATIGTFGGGRTISSGNIPHGLGTTPTWFFGCCGYAPSTNTSSGVNEAVAASPGAADATNISFVLGISGTATCTTGPGPLIWLAIA